MAFSFLSAIYGQPLLALFNTKRYINPILDSALYSKKSAILPLPAPFTIAL